MENIKSPPRIAFISSDLGAIVNFTHEFRDDFEIKHFSNVFHFFQWIKENSPLSLIVTNSDLLAANGISLRKNCKTLTKTAHVPFVLIVDRITTANKNIALIEQFADIFEHPLKKEDFMKRALYLIENPPRYHKSIIKNPNSFPKFATPLTKRAFDIAFSITAIITLSPFLLLVAAIISIESKGTVLYTSKRVGSGYTLFDFYKFRSMRVGSDSLLKNLQHLNQYGNSEPTTVDDFKAYLCEECKTSNSPCKSKLFMDGEMICEKVYAAAKLANANAKFTKIENDPRITRFGKFMRNTSIDELPQLFNVLKGDMSIVGNRPLPLYEAEKLTTDQFALRFMAPAGITGLWQVSKRGKGGQMSEAERMELDNEYAKNNSFWKDLLLIIKTIPALFQKASS